MDKLIIFTDGSSLHNGKNNCCAGYGVYFPNSEFPNVSEKVLGKQSNNSAELGAINKCLDIIKDIKNKNIIIYSDSMYSIKALTIWYKKWEKDNWEIKKDVKRPNYEIIQLILKQIEHIKVNNTLEFKHIKSHTGNDDFFSKCNDIVDQLAKQSIDVNIKKKIKDTSTNIILPSINPQQNTSKNNQLSLNTYIAQYLIDINNIYHFKSVDDLINFIKEH